MRGLRPRRIGRPRSVTATAAITVAAVAVAAARRCSGFSWQVASAFFAAMQACRAPSAVFPGLVGDLGKLGGSTLRCGPTGKMFLAQRLASSESLSPLLSAAVVFSDPCIKETWTTSNSIGCTSSSVKVATQVRGVASLHSSSVACLPGPPRSVRHRESPCRPCCSCLVELWISHRLCLQ